MQEIRENILDETRNSRNLDSGYAAISNCVCLSGIMREDAPATSVIAKVMSMTFGRLVVTEPVDDAGATRFVVLDQARKGDKEEWEKQEKGEDDAQSFENFNNVHDLKTWNLVSGFPGQFVSEAEILESRKTGGACKTFNDEAGALVMARPSSTSTSTPSPPTADSGSTIELLIDLIAEAQSEALRFGAFQGINAFLHEHDEVYVSWLVKGGAKGGKGKAKAKENELYGWSDE